MMTHLLETQYTIQDIERTVHEILKSSEDRQMRTDTELILWEILQYKNRAEIYLNRNQKISEEKRIAILDIARKRSQGIPLQHLLKKVEFFSLEMCVSPSSFIPRPETELLVENVIRWIKGQSLSKVHILDIGTGSGNIPISIAKNIPQASIVALDISYDALRVAQKNIHFHNVSSQIHLVASDLTTALSRRKTFDLIVSNPPYIDEEDWPSLSEEVRLHEPFQALWGGKNGMETISKIFQNLPYLIKPEGAFFMEYGGSKQTPFILDAAQETEIFQSIEILKDLNGEDRIFKAIR